MHKQAPFIPIEYPIFGNTRASIKQRLLLGIKIHVVSETSTNSRISFAVGFAANSQLGFVSTIRSGSGSLVGCLPAQHR